MRETEEQRNAILSRGKTIVSAFAGSGKTYVMIRRLVSLLLEGKSLENILAVTFTNKAADQMKERLRSALVEEIASGGKLFLKEQLSLLPSSEISTIHSFCSRLIKSYFYLVGIDPSFRVISPEDPEAKQIVSSALDEVFERFYESDEESLSLLSVYFYKKKDLKLKKLIYSLYQKARGELDYRKKLKEAGKDRFEEAERFLFEEYQKRASFVLERAEEFGALEGKDFEFCKKIEEKARALLGAQTLFSMAHRAKESLPLRAPSNAKLSGEKLILHEKLKTLSAFLRDLEKELLSFGSEEEEKRKEKAGEELSRGLSALILQYDEVYSRLKREKNVLDYNDLEQFAIEILSDEETKKSVRERFQYVFVDEYQDVNPAQEKILSLVSSNDLFLVGDAKQSIYGFRGSRSEYFKQKELEFAPALPLSESFRSSGAVLSIVNDVFSYALTPRFFGISYKENPMRGGRFGIHYGAAKTYLVKEEKCERELKGVYSVQREEPEKRDLKSEAIVDLILSELGSEYFDADLGEEKSVSFGDIAVLVRKKSGQAEKLVSLLSRAGIPVTTTSSVNVCSFWEAKLMIDYLSFLDNETQDIPLCSALLSRIGGFSEEELLLIRSAHREGSFYEACKRYKGEPLEEKLLAFFEKSKRHRALSRVKSAKEMGNLLLFEGLEAEIAAKKDGKARLLRVRRLLADGDCPIGEFLRRLKATNFAIDFSECAGEDAVKVLTMHSSKGLEYPIVILADMNAPFHGPDRDEVLFSDRFFLAPKCYDLEKKTSSETILRRALLLFSENEERKGELNLLYVAMTRAKYRLHLLFSYLPEALSPDYASRFADFFNGEIFLRYLSDLPPKGEPLSEKEALAVNASPEEEEKILKLLSFSYPFERAISLPVKTSASELLKRQEDSFPTFQEEKRSLSKGGSVEEGIAYHAFLEKVRFGESAKEALSRLKSEAFPYLSELNEDKLEKILTLPVFSLLKGKKILREQKFLVLLPASEIAGLEGEEEIVFQGAIDLFSLDDKLLLDYKYSSRPKEELKARYAPQIQIYKKAAAKILKLEEREIRAKIVNINLLEEIEMD